MLARLRSNPPLLLRHLLALAFVGLACLLRLILFRAGVYNLYLPFFPAIIAAAIYGGLLPGFTALVACALITANWPNPPTLVPTQHVELGSLVAFLVVATMMIAISFQMRLARKIAETQAAARIKAEATTSERDLVIRKLVDSNAIGIVFADKDRFTFANDAFLQMVGYSVDDIAAGRLRPADMTPPQYAQIDHAALEQIHQKGVCDPYAKEFIRRDGSLLPVLIGAALVDPDKPTYVCYISDQSARVRAEAAQAHLAAIVASSSDAIVSKSLDGVIRSWNHGAQELFGYTPEETIGQSIFLIVPPERRDEERDILRRISAGETVDHFETQRLTKDGRRLNIALTVSPVKDSTGRIIGASKIARDITLQRQREAEREHLLAAERSARADAERASRVKDEFLATISHELRTPLHAILGWSQLLAAGSPSRTDLAQGLDTIVRNARIQSQLIEDLLDMSRIISGKLRLDVQTVDLPAIINDALATVRPAAEAKGVRLESVLDPLAAPVKGDPARLQQIVWNLLSNAIKFTPRDGKVQVVLERVNSHIEVSVSDTGQGIDPAFLPRVFDRFSQADGSTTRKHGGLGLGLAIVKNLCELHGGQVRAKSLGPGKGSTFIVSLPLSVAHPHAQGESRQHPTSQHDAASAPPAPEPSLAGVTILVVDDEPDARTLIRRILESAGATVLTAASTAEALAMLPVQRPQLLLSDIGMPGEDGYALIRQVRALPPHEGGLIPAAALTAFARSEDRRRVLMNGFQTHIPKPVEPSELITVLASLMGRAQTLSTP